MLEAGSYLVRVPGRELLIPWASGSFFTWLKILRGKHQRVSKSDSVIISLPNFRCSFELLEFSLLPCNPRGLSPTLPLFSWPAFTSLPNMFFFLSRPPLIQFLLPADQSPLNFGNTQPGEIWLSVSQSTLLCWCLSLGFALPCASQDALSPHRKTEHKAVDTWLNTDYLLGLRCFFENWKGRSAVVVVET